MGVHFRFDVDIRTRRPDIRSWAYCKENEMLPSDTSGLTRRRILQLGTSAAAFGVLSSFSRAWTVSGSDRWPRAVLKGSAAEKVDERQFLDLGQMRAWYEELDDRGLRATGSRSQ